MSIRISILLSRILREKLYFLMERVKLKRRRSASLRGHALGKFTAFRVSEISARARERAFESDTFVQMFGLVVFVWLVVIESY